MGRLLLALVVALPCLQCVAGFSYIHHVDKYFYAEKVLPSYEERINNLCVDVPATARDDLVATAAVRAVSHGSYSCVHTLLDAGLFFRSTANTVDAGGLTVLAHVASRIDGDESLLLRLLPLTDVRCARWQCQAPLSLAANRKFVVALISAGAALDGLDSQGHSPLQLSALKQRWDVAISLIQAGSNPNVDVEGMPLMERAAAAGRWEAVVAFLEAGANPPGADTFWDSDMFFADWLQELQEACFLYTVKLGSESCWNRITKLRVLAKAMLIVKSGRSDLYRGLADRFANICIERAVAKIPPP